MSQGVAFGLRREPTEKGYLPVLFGTGMSQGVASGVIRLN